MVKGLFIPADGKQPIEQRDYTRLEDYQAAVGGWIEAVDIKPMMISMYVNENGIAERLEPNLRATFLWWMLMPHVRGKANLFGDAALVGYPDENGDSTDTPEVVLELLTTPRPYVVMIRIAGTWYRGLQENRDYMEAVHWAMMKLSREPEIEDVGVMPPEQADRFPKRSIPPLPKPGRN